MNSKKLLTYVFKKGAKWCLIVNMAAYICLHKNDMYRVFLNRRSCLERQRVNKGLLSLILYENRPPQLNDITARGSTFSKDH
jgi:hypothetical protein